MIAEIEQELALWGALPEGRRPEQPPLLLPGAESIWEAWQALQLSRDVGFGIGAIRVSEVLAYCELLGIRDLEVRESLLRQIQAMDGVFLKHCADKAEESKPRE
jgi:hypothetical protein